MMKAIIVTLVSCIAWLLCLIPFVTIIVTPIVWIFKVFMHLDELKAHFSPKVVGISVLGFIIGIAPIPNPIPIGPLTVAGGYAIAHIEQKKKAREQHEEKSIREENMKFNEEQYLISRERRKQQQIILTEQDSNEEEAVIAGRIQPSLRSSRPLQQDVNRRAA